VHSKTIVEMVQATDHVSKMGYQLLIPLYCNQWDKATGSSEPILICCLPGWTLNPAGISQGRMHCGKYGCESSNVWWWYMCVHPSVNGLQCLLNICGDYAAEHEITFNCNKNMKSLLIATKQLLLFFAQKSITTCPIKCFSKWCTCTIFLTKWNILVCG